MLVSGCRWKVLLEGAVGLACWCCCTGDASGCCKVRNVPARVLVKGVAARCCCRVLHHGAIKVVCALWSWYAGAIASCNFRCGVPLSDFSQKQREA